MYTDCDTDTILVKAQPFGPTCHTGKRSCFSWKVDG
ncbi:MAG: phosphoribosyl-AMP cyclohydrolase [candidate division KSB1 bacterium]|nr:phosphoribosyl-AMP cyclohydrolase [candidate division KSB1 bacterium]